MTTWNGLLQEFLAQPDGAKGKWLYDSLTRALGDIATQRNDRHVLLYGSAFLQKPEIPSNFLIITHEDLNGLMGAIHGMDWTRGLTLVLHTPGGQTNATESIVAYLRSKFTDIEVIVPTYAMSAGTMISLASNRIVLGRHSQLGPIDPQMVISGGSVSARAVVEQFERAKSEIHGDVATAHAWAPVLQSLGPSLLQEAQNALDYSEEIVAKWLKSYMFGEATDGEDKGKTVAGYFNAASLHKSHGRRIGRDEARDAGVVVEDLEGDDRQDLQEAVLTAYHLMTLVFEQSPTGKVILSDTGNSWIKNFQSAEEAAAIAAAAQRIEDEATPDSDPHAAPGTSRPGNRAEQRRNAKRKR